MNQITFNLNKIRDFYNINSLIKNLCGLRRSGKSVILKQIIEEIKETGVKEDHIIYINFESLDYSNIETAKDLDIHSKSILKTLNKYYVTDSGVKKN